jgi:IgGFc binding protein
MSKTRPLLILFIVTMFLYCEAENTRSDSSGGNDADSDTDSDGDSDTDNDADTDSDSDTGTSDNPCDNTGNSNQGCEFWAVDLPNVSKAPLAVTPHDQQFAVVVANTSADVSANVSVYLGGGNMLVETKQVGIDQIVTFELPSQNIQPGATTNTGIAYRIESDVPITAYQFNPLDNTSKVYSNDASLLFPVHVLSMDYTAITGSANLVAADGFSVAKLNTGGFVAVVATEDDTTVTLYPTNDLYPGNYQNVLLARGQVLTAIASKAGANGSLSGTRVVADKNVAVFGGSVATSEPANTKNCCADHVEHQMLPLEAWGSTYAVAPAVAAKGGSNHKSIFRISAAFDGTTLEYSPSAPDNAPTTLNAYETAEVMTNEPFIVTSTDPKKSFSVTQFLLSNQFFTSGLTSSYPGDPSMIVLPALDQFQTEYVFLIPDGYNFNYVTIVRPDDTDITLDGAPITDQFSALGTHKGTSYQYAHVTLSPGHHIIKASQAIAITLTGYSNDVSFGYPGGSGVKQISEPPQPPV